MASVFLSSSSCLFLRFRSNRKTNLNTNKFLSLRSNRPRTLASGSNRPATSDDESTPTPPPPPAVKKSLAVATGEVFLSLASFLTRKGRGSEVETDIEAPADQTGTRPRFLVAEDRVDKDIIWEQNAEDIETEKERKVVTSPGFSFSAAGLLFPYHLGVAKLLLEKGYIKETTPLAGSSAGSIVCAVIASGNSMEDTLKITKILAEDCRLKGTAFRLGVNISKC